MTEPKQSFTEEVQKEAAERADHNYIEEKSYTLRQHELTKEDFLAGAKSALSILSRKTEGREFYIEPMNYEPSFKDLPDGFDACVHTTGFQETIHVIEYSALVAERARNGELEAQNSALDKMYELQSEVRVKLESENAALKAEFADISKLRDEEGLKHFKQLTTLRARADAFTELSNKLAAQLALCKEQRNHRVKMTDEFPRMMIEKLDIELQKKGQGDE